MAMLRGAGESDTVTVRLDTQNVSRDVPARVMVQSSDTRIEFQTTGGEFLRAWRSLLTTEPSGCGPATVTAEYLARFAVKVPGRGVVASPYVTLVPNEEGKPLHVFIREDDRTVLHGLIMPVRDGGGGFPEGTTWAECALPS